MSRYLICYDICHPKRWRKIFKACAGVCEHLQYSVFYYEGSQGRLNHLMRTLAGYIHPDEDDLRLYPLSSPEPFFWYGEKTLLPPSCALIRKNIQVNPYDEEEW